MVQEYRDETAGKAGWESHQEQYLRIRYDK